MLDFVVIDGQHASFGEHARKFPNYFGIDSISLMLGKNGSGKTRLLQSVAEVLTAGAPLGDQGRWQISDSADRVVVGDTRKPPPGVGVVYFTPLKYQRSMGGHRRFVNASTLKAETIKMSMLKNFSDVARSLGAPTQLTAALSYQPSIFERLVIPTLRELHASIIESGVAEAIRKFSEQADRLSIVEKTPMMKSLSREIQVLTENMLDSRHGQMYRIAALATLENFGKELRDRFDMTAAILEVLGLLNLDGWASSERSRMSKIANDFRLAVDASLVVASSSNVQPIRESDIGFEFEIEDIQQLRDIENSVSSFQLSWANLSSGLLSLVDQFARLDVALERLSSRSVRTAVVLVDEGDSYLHLDWQRQYIESLDQFLTAAKKRYGFSEVQAVVATHSPIISGDFPSLLVQRLGAEMPVGTKTFGNSLDALVLDAFGTPSIGSKAAHQVRRLRKAFVSQTLTNEDRDLIAEIGDERLKRAVVAPRSAGE